MSTYTFQNIIYNYNVPLSGTTGIASVANNTTTNLSGSIDILENFTINGITYTVTAIQAGAFNGKNLVTNINIPNSITNIGNNAFQSSGIRYVLIPKSVLNIGSLCFAGCNSLKLVLVTNPNTIIGSNIFYNSPGQLYISNNINNDIYLYNNIFYYINYSTLNSSIIINTTDSLTSLTINSITFNNIEYPVTSIYNNAFKNYTGLTSISMPLVTSIGNSAFQGCSGLTSISMPLVTSIGYSAFQGCSGLTSITIPSSVTNISQQAFYLCTNLTSVTFLGLIPTVGPNNFTNASDNIIYDQVLNAGNPNLAAMLALFTTNTPYVPICFPEGTPVVTDQGEIAIEKINPDKNTIRGKKIVAITKTVTLENKIVCIEKDALGTNVPSQKTFISRNHKLLYNKKMIKAKNLIGQVDGVYNKKYNGEVLYNVLLDTHEKMLVNNLIVETLDPKNIVAQLYNGSLSEEKRNNAIININHCANEYKKQYGKLK